MTNEKLRNGISVLFSPDYPFDANLLNERITAQHEDSIEMYSGARDSRFVLAEKSFNPLEGYYDFWADNDWDPEEVLLTNPLTWVHYGITEALIAKKYPSLYVLVEPEYWALARMMFDKISKVIEKKPTFQYTYSGRNVRIYSYGARYSVFASLCFSTALLAGVSDKIGSDRKLLKDGVRLEEAIHYALQFEHRDKGTDYKVTENLLDETETFFHDEEEYDYKQMFPYAFIDILRKYREGLFVFYASPVEMMYRSVEDQYFNREYKIEEIPGPNSTGIESKVEFSSTPTNNLSFWVMSAIKEFETLCTPNSSNKSQDNSKHNRARTFEERIAALRLKGKVLDNSEGNDFSRTILKDVEGLIKYLKVFYSTLAKNEEGIKVEIPVGLQKAINLQDILEARQFGESTSMKIRPSSYSGKKSSLIIDAELNLKELEEEEEPVYRQFVNCLEIRSDYDIRNQINLGKSEAMKACVFRVEQGRAERWKNRKKDLRDIGFSSYNIRSFSIDLVLSQNMLYSVIQKNKGSKVLEEVKKIVTKFRRNEKSSKEAGEEILRLIS